MREENEIPLDLLLKMMKASGNNLEIIDEGKDIRIKGFFSVNIQNVKGGEEWKKQ